MNGHLLIWVLRRKYLGELLFLFCFCFCSVTFGVVGLWLVAVIGPKTALFYWKAQANIALATQCVCVSTIAVNWKNRLTEREIYILSSISICTCPCNYGLIENKYKFNRKAHLEMNYNESSYSLNFDLWWCKKCSDFM